MLPYCNIIFVWLLLITACERLILLRTEEKELRDYSILLYHCGFYEQSLQYLKLYQESKVTFLISKIASCVVCISGWFKYIILLILQGFSSSPQKQSRDSLSGLEEDAAEKLMVRLNLLSMEEGWTKPSSSRNFLGNNSEPW